MSISNIGIFAARKNKRLRTTCDKDDFPSEAGDVGCRVERDACHGGWLTASASGFGSVYADVR